MSSSDLALNAFLLVLGLAAVSFLLRPSMFRSALWRATLTPLSSIMGSGFLIMAPLLASVVGALSPLAVLGIVLLAYSIGHVIRFNITHIEPKLANGGLAGHTREIEYLSNVVLVGAYVIAVAFYLSLLSNFVLSCLGLSEPVAERLLTTGIIAFIAVVGYFKGLTGLERLEGVSAAIQLSVVLALIAGLAIFAVGFLDGGKLAFDHPDRDVWTQFRILAGALLVVQGFETSRFLGEKYSPDVRIRSMRIAQLVSGILYVVSVLLLMPVVQRMDLMDVELAAIIDVMLPVALVLPVMLMVAAVTSQFSAAVADLGGGGGLLRENSQGRLSSQLGYLAVAVCAILLVWMVDLFEIIALASRAFAAYYFLQTLLAIIYNYKDCPHTERLTIFNEILFVLLAVILACIAVFSIPAG